MKLKLRAIILVIFSSAFCMYKFYRSHKIAHQRKLKDHHHLENRNIVPVDDSIFEEPMQLHDSKSSNDEIIQLKGKYEIDVSTEMDRLCLDMQGATVDDAQRFFKIAAEWVSARQVYPHNHPELVSILKIMATAPIVQADALPKGTQIKLLLVLEGGQKVVFKQKRYERDYVIEGKPYDGYDRHNAEIAAFHLDRLLDFRRSPLVVGRTINLKEEIMPVATERLLKTFRKKDGNTCYFGMCLYCNEKNMACADGEKMEGSLTLWLPEKWTEFEKHRHPYQRTYRPGHSARWENDEFYCNSVVKKKAPYDRGPRLLDVTDGTVFDYLIGNADRHHYEVFRRGGPDAMLLMMDNAKRLRNSTWVRMQQLQNGVLTQLLETAMKNDPIAPILHPSHIKAMDSRLITLIDTVTECIAQHGTHNVIVNEWNGL